MRFNIPGTDGAREYFGGVADRMVKAGWIKRLVEIEMGDGGVYAERTLVGLGRAREVASLVQPLTSWLRDKSKPRPSAAIQFDCLLQLAPLIRELGPPEMDEAEILKFIALVAVCAPETPTAGDGGAE